MYFNQYLINKLLCRKLQLDIRTKVLQYLYCVIGSRSSNLGTVVIPT